MKIEVWPGLEFVHVRVEIHSEPSRFVLNSKSTESFVNRTEFQLETNQIS